MKLKEGLQVFSMPVVGIATLIFASAIGLATFIENMYETNAARALVYNAWWFEMLLAYIAIALVVNVFTKRMIRKGRVGVLLFHISVFFILLGAAISRFTGEQGMMHIREGASSNTVTSSDVFFDARLLVDGKIVDETSEKVFPSLISRGFFSGTLKHNELRCKIKTVDYQKPDGHGGITAVKLICNGESKEQWVRQGAGSVYSPVSVDFGDFQVVMTFGSKPFTVPFYLQLDTFEIARYPGSMSPSSFKSYVTVLDDNAFKAEIYMNHVLHHKGYRFFQSSYDEDEKGTVLSVNADPVGSTVTYFGYALLMIGMLMGLFDRKSRFRGLLNSSKRRYVTASVAVLMMMVTSNTAAQSGEISGKNAKAFGMVCLQTTDGRVKPINSFASEIVRKVHKSGSYNNLMPEQVLLGIIREPAKWEHVPFIANGNDDVKKYLKISDKYLSFSQCFDKSTGAYLLTDVLQRINKLSPELRTKSDKSFINLDERLNIFNMLKNGRLINIVPDISDADAAWLDLFDASSQYRGRNDSIAIVFNYLIDGLIVGDNAQFEGSLEIINAWQSSFSGHVLPSDVRIKSELLYNRINIFERLAAYYGLISVLFMIITIWLLVKKSTGLRRFQTVLLWLLIAGFLVHTVGLVLRGIIAGYVPLSNGYETMVFVAWSSLLAGIIFVRHSRLVMALFGFLAAASLLVAHLSFMNPQITTLVPVLKSYWLTIHVAVITSSYGFLGGSFIMGVITLIMMLFLNDKNKFVLGPVVRNLITINRIIMIPGLYLITIGCFLGAIWANQSWGNYWSWDPKETWCLVSILVYSFVVHLHHFPGMRGKFLFLIGSIFSYAAIVMTFFGVNYFLGGMHSYAGEGSVSIPLGVYISVPLLILLIWKANKNNKKYLSLMYC